MDFFWAFCVVILVGTVTENASTKKKCHYTFPLDLKCNHSKHKWTCLKLKRRESTIQTPSSVKSKTTEVYLKHRPWSAYDHLGSLLLQK